MEQTRRNFRKHYLKEIVAGCLVFCLLLTALLPVVRADVVPGMIEGENVITPGPVNFNTVGNTTTITTSNMRTIIEYNRFNIDAGKWVHFAQPGVSAATLNRIIKANPSLINGKLTSNGGIYIINPANVIFGAGAKVSVPRMVASGLNMNYDDFLKGVMKFSGGNGIVENYGEILAKEVALIGKKVLNAGTIVSPGGYVLMASGDSIYLGTEGSDVIVEVAGVTVPQEPLMEGMGDVINEGTVEAAGGKIVLAAGDTFSRAIDGLDGLTVAVEGGTGRVGQFGTLNADGVEGDGGSITLTAGDVVALSPDSLTTANAGTNGDGGEVIVFSPDTALFWPDAQIEAKGGTSSGDGGFVEVSGKESMIFEGKVDLTASNGGRGTLLIDPKNITITDTGTDVVLDNDEFLEPAPPGDGSGNVEFSDENIEAALDGANLTLQANTDITVSYPVDSSAGAGGDLTLQAGRSIDIDENITLNGSLTATADDPAAEPTQRDPGPGDIDIATGATIDTSGSISLSGESVNVRGNLESGSDVTINATKSVWVGETGTPRDLVVSNGELTVTSEDEAIHLTGITESKGDMILDAETFISADDDIISTEGSVSITTQTDNTSLWGDLKAKNNVLLSTNLELGGGEWVWNNDLGAWIWDSINLIEAATGTITAGDPDGHNGWIWKRFPGELHMYAGADGKAIDLLYDDDMMQPTVQTGGNLYMYGIGDIQIAGDPFLMPDLTAMGSVFPAPFPFPGWDEKPVLDPWLVGGVSVISENGKIYTEGATPENALDIRIDGFSDDISHRMDWTSHVPPYFTKFPPAAGVDLPIKDNGDALGKAAIVLQSKETLKLAEYSALVAFGVYNPLDPEGEIQEIPGVDDRPGIEFLDTDNTTIGGHVRDEGIPSDVAIYAASTQGDVEVYTDYVRVIYMPLVGPTINNFGNGLNNHEPVETGPATVVFDAYDTVRFPFLEGASSFTDMYLKMIGFPTVEDYLDFIDFSLDDFLTIVGYPTFEEYAESIIKEMMRMGDFRVEVCSRITEWLSQAIANETLPFADDTTFMEELYEDYVLRGAGLGNPAITDGRKWVLEDPPPFVAAAPLAKLEFPKLTGCPLELEAVAIELGITREELQMSFGNSLALNPNVQPCDACARLMKAATTLMDADGSRMAAMNEVFNVLAPPEAPFTPEMAASIATAFAELAGEQAQYALAMEYIDAFVEYVAVLDTELGAPVGDSVEFVMGKHGTTVTESANANIAGYVMSRLEALGG